MSFKFYHNILFQIKLLENYDIFIDSTKLKAMKHRGVKNASRVVRDLLLYFFTHDYLATHSATGMKSTKKGLPVELLQPIRGTVLFKASIKLVVGCGLMSHSVIFQLYSDGTMV